MIWSWRHFVKTQQAYCCQDLGCRVRKPSRKWNDNHGFSCKTQSVMEIRKMLIRLKKVRFFTDCHKVFFFTVTKLNEKKKTVTIFWCLSHTQSHVKRGPWRGERGSLQAGTQHFSKLSQVQLQLADARLELFEEYVAVSVTSDDKLPMFNLCQSQQHRP